MLELDWQVERQAGVALVELVVRNPTDAARRVRVGNRLSGPVRPPRREGVPAAGWDDGGFEGVVPPRECRALGYASPVADGDSTTEPPATLVWSERAGASASETHPDAFADEATPEGVVRALGDPRPPADAVPAPDDAPEPDAPVPESVESWLSAVEERARSADDGTESLAPTPEDRAALERVESRIEALRSGDRSERPRGDDRTDRRGRRSP
ncbi:DUF7857 domain-containing protein [Halorussus pelagicus]|uniref:DUF7857 domain-containing protein n=1 Tax=Halorussus pelagicus TaxID=2505977 RepID=UPI000FFC09B1|nr:hypothetical protein [Halorussus pelagicus]